ncbi:hypothetical protein MRX96_056116 [Rhipicephalus microplus]
MAQRTWLSENHGIPVSVAFNLLTLGQLPKRGAAEMRRSRGESLRSTGLDAEPWENEAFGASASWHVVLARTLPRASNTYAFFPRGTLANKKPPLSQRHFTACAKRRMFSRSSRPHRCANSSEKANKQLRFTSLIFFSA